MPKQKASASDQRKRSFRTVIAKQMTFLGISKEQLTAHMKMSRTTLWSKLNDPDSFRVRELRLLYDVLKFSEEEMRILL